MGGNELLHESNASFVLHDVDSHAARTQEILVPTKRTVLADDDVRNAVEKNRAAAHRTRRQRRVHDTVPVNARRQPPGALERIHFTVEDGTPLLNAAIVTATGNHPLMDQNRADRNPAFASPAFGLLDSRQ